MSPHRAAVPQGRVSGLSFPRTTSERPLSNKRFLPYCLDEAYNGTTEQRNIILQTMAIVAL